MPPRRSRLLPAMFALLVAVFFVVLGYTRWLDTRLRPVPAPVDVAAPAPPATTEAPPPSAPATSIQRCVAPGRAPMLVSGPCPPGTTLDRSTPVAATGGRDAATERARQQCEAAKRRERIELEKLGGRRTRADMQLWGDFVLRECAAYQAALGPGRKK